MQLLQIFLSQVLEQILPFYDAIANNIGNIFLATVVLLIGFVIGYAVERTFVRMGKNEWVQLLSEKSGFADLLKKADIHTSAVAIIGKSLNGYILTLFFLSSAKILSILAIEEFLQSIIDYLPRLVIALIIVLVGIRFAGTTASLISSGFQLAESAAGKILAVVARGVIITFSILAALVYLEIAPLLINVLFIGFVSMITLAGGISFGMGGIKTVEKFLEDLRDHKGKKQGQKKKYTEDEK